VTYRVQSIQPKVCSRQGAYGLEVCEADVFISNVRQNRLTRTEHIKLFEVTYIDQSNLKRAGELCIPCMEAVLDAASEQERP